MGEDRFLRQASSSSATEAISDQVRTAASTCTADGTTFTAAKGRTGTAENRTFTSSCAAKVRTVSSTPSTPCNETD
jgi:hypothetical protein